MATCPKSLTRELVPIITRVAKSAAESTIFEFWDQLQRTKHLNCVFTNWHRSGGKSWLVIYDLYMAYIRLIWLIYGWYIAYIWRTYWLYMAEILIIYGLALAYIRLIWLRYGWDMGEIWPRYCCMSEKFHQNNFFYPFP